MIRHWIKILHGVEAHEAELVNEYGRFRASFNDETQADIWTAAATKHPLLWWRAWGDEFPTLAKLAMKLLSLPPSAASAERNWSTQDFIISKRRNRLLARRAMKLVYIYYNLRSLARAEAQRRGPGITDEALERWHTTLIAHTTFQWPSEADGKHMYEWESDGDDAEFEGMHGDELADDDDEDDVDEEEADRQEEEAAKEPFECDTFATPGEGYEVMLCPSKLPHDLEVGMKMAQWFGPPYNAWYVGKVSDVNRRRTVSENVSVEFSEEMGETTSVMVADKETYGADKLWVLLKPIPINVGSDSGSPSDEE